MRLVEVLFHQITEADIKKVEASSNNAETGGGARDLRFSIRFKDCLDRFFPEVVTKDGKSEYKIGSFRYIDSSNHEQVITNVKYAFKPTASRPNEIRIAQINTLEFFRDMPVLSHDDGLLFMCFMRFDEGLPLAQYVTQKRSCAPKSSRKIAEAMARAIDETKGNSAVVFSVSLDWVKKAEMTIDNVAILELLSKEKNVLLCGAPATGKTTLLNGVEELFNGSLQKQTIFAAEGDAAFPEVEETYDSALAGFGCSCRKVFRTTFHQGTRYRDFVRGIIPEIGQSGASFKVSRGLLYEAAEYAKQQDHAALLIIDEINRGPAVAAFGDVISAFEADKRLGDDGKPIPGKTVTISILDDNAELTDFALPARLYILAAMNQADSSVEPMDTAFLRRWYSVELLPDYSVLSNYFGLRSEPLKATPPQVPSSAEDVYALATLMLERINKKISIGRGLEYQLGHGVLMKAEKPPMDVNDALRYIASCWPSIQTHIEEVFFGNTEAMSDVLNAKNDGHGFFEVDYAEFAGRQIMYIANIGFVEQGNIYEMMLSLLD